MPDFMEGTMDYHPKLLHYIFIRANPAVQELSKNATVSVRIATQKSGHFDFSCIKKAFDNLIRFCRIFP